MSFNGNDCDKCTETKMCAEHEIEQLEWEIMRNQDRIEKLKNNNKGILLVRAAKKAATTGNRKDLQEYLKMRRQYL